jgi:hypothetical protein
MLVAAREGTSANTVSGFTIRDAGLYSARNSSKGALIDEAARVFNAISAGARAADVREQCLRGTLLSQRSSQNRERIWTSLQQRYLTAGVGWVTSLLAEKSVRGVHDPEFTSLLYLFYSLRDRLTYDFVTSVLWPKGHRGRPAISRNDVLDLLASAAQHQPQIDRWSESTRVKLAGSVLTALRDFGVLEGKQKKLLVKPPLPLSTATALLRVLISEGCRGRRVLEDHTWRLYLITEAEVAQLLSSLARAGEIRFEKAGTTVVLETPEEWESER